MKNFQNTEGSVWMAIIVVVAVVIAALLLSGSLNLGFLNLESDRSITGRVEEVNQEEDYFNFTHIEVISVAENGDAEIEETTYTAVWAGQDESQIGPDQPSSLQVGQMVEVTPATELEEGQLAFPFNELDITREADAEESGEQQTENNNSNGAGPVEAGLTE